MATAPEAPLADLWGTTSETTILSDLLVAQRVGADRQAAHDLGLLLGTITGDFPELDMEIIEAQNEVFDLFARKVQRIGPYALTYVETGLLVVSSDESDTEHLVTRSLAASSTGPGELVQLRKTFSGIDMTSGPVAIPSTPLPIGLQDIHTAMEATNRLRDANTAIRADLNL